MEIDNKDRCANVDKAVCRNIGDVVVIEVEVRERGQCI